MELNLDTFIDKFGGWTEEYIMYNGEITLRYDPKDHAYLLLNADGTLEKQAGVTTVCHIIDKSEALVPWGCKVMAQKLLANAAPFKSQVFIPELGPYYSFNEADFERIVNESKSAHKERLEEAGDIGHIAHAWIENYIKAVLAENEYRKNELLATFPLDERAANCCHAALDWMQRHNVRWISTERKIYSKKYRYAGTMDGLCRVDSCDNLECCPHQFKNRLTIADWKTSNYLYLEYLLQTAAYQQAYEEEMNEEIEDRWVIRLGKEDGEFDPWHLETTTTFEDDWRGFFRALELSRQVQVLRDRIQSIKDLRTAKRKEEARLAREATLKIACANSRKYQGIRKPRCNQGNPCESCQKKYEEVQYMKAAAKAMDKLMKDEEKAAKKANRKAANPFDIFKKETLADLMSDQ